MADSIGIDRQSKLFQKFMQSKNVKTVSDSLKESR